MVRLTIKSVGVVAKDMLDYQQWVARQVKDEYVRYFPVTNAIDVATKYDEIIVTTMANTNPNFYSIYIKLNGAYAMAKKEAKHLEKTL